MNRVIPCIREHANELEQRLQHGHKGHRKPRLQVLYLLASGQAHTRQAVAHLLGVNRNTISRWLALYAAGDLAGYLRPHRETHLTRARGPHPPRAGPPPPGRLCLV
jgi:hypothetical protein